MAFFRSLKIQDWQQFGTVEVAFHDRMTIITGANASGKTTLLNILARHAEWNVPALAVPASSGLGGIFKYLTRFFGGKNRSSDPAIGVITYDNGRQANLVVPDINEPNYHVTIQDPQPVPCFFVPAHRSVYRYQRLSTIPAVRLNRQEAFERVWTSTRNRFFGNGDISSSFHLKEVLIAWSLFGRGNSDMPPDPEVLQLYEGFQDVLRRVLPESLGFRRFAIRNAEIVLECNSADFMIDGASGGLSALIDLAWQIYMYAPLGQVGFTVLMDEVENHLHPTMQRRVLTDLLSTFHDVRFIVTTHSPLIVNSVRDSTVYALRYDQRQQIASDRLDFVSKARTAAQILDEVLGVSSTLPVWVEKELDTIARELSNRNLDQAAFDDVRNRLRRIGLDDYLPQALGRLLDWGRQ